MRRKLWIISLVLVLTCGSLTACGGNGDDEDEDEDEDGRGRLPHVALVQHEWSLSRTCRRHDRMSARPTGCVTAVAPLVSTWRWP